MNIDEARAILVAHNAWRRGEDEDAGMEDPTQIGIAIDTLVAVVARLEQTDALLDRLVNAAATLVAECDTDLEGEHDYSQDEIDEAALAAKWCLHDWGLMRETQAGQMGLGLGGDA